MRNESAERATNNTANTCRSTVVLPVIASPVGVTRQAGAGRFRDFALGAGIARTAPVGGLERDLWMREQVSRPETLAGPWRSD